MRLPLKTGSLAECSNRGKESLHGEEFKGALHAGVQAAQTLEFLKAPPGNRLEALKGNRKGQHSIRINDQWRICFVWTDVGPAGVEIVDYH